MDKGRIDKAPIIHDVHLLNKASVTTRRVDAVFGGFPCQDISTAKANGEGLAGPRSSLFWEIMRIIDDFGSVRFVMLENVRNLLRKGYDIVKQALEQRGFDVRHVVMSARQLGAPHVRYRIFIIAVRSSPALPPIQRKLSTRMWASEGPPRVIEAPIEIRPIMKKRASMCGNSIVPHCIQYAYSHMIHGSKLPNRPRSWDIVMKDNKVIIQKDTWGTPFANLGLYRVYPRLTERSSQMLTNQVIYDTKRKVFIQPYLNPRFAEWLMGLPPDYTHFKRL